MKYTIQLFIIVLLTGCFQRSYLSEEIRHFAPYSEGQKLTFVSSNNEISTLTITEVSDSNFSSGQSPLQIEILYVYSTLKTAGSTENRIVSLITGLAERGGREEEIVFSINLGKVAMEHRVPFSQIKDRKVKTFSNHYGEFDDVMTLEFEYIDGFRIPDSEITKFHWSRSKGYVRLVQHDGTIWDLKSIESR